MILLIIENNITISLQFKERMDFYNIDYKIANTGVEAYKILYDAEKCFDYIITNIGLPDENGVEIIKFIQKNYNSKIIVYTGKKLYKNKVSCDYYYDKNRTTPSEIINMIVNENLT